jgi:hypothetical protein
MDVHKVESQVCILSESGEIIERRIRTERERFGAVLGARPRARILIEASTESEKCVGWNQIVHWDSIQAACFISAFPYAPS